MFYLALAGIVAVMDNVFLVDVEATGGIPRSGVMTEAGIVHFESGDGFYVRTHNFTPDPEVLPGFRPVVDLLPNGQPDVCIGFKVSSGSDSAADACSMDGFTEVLTMAEVGVELRKFVNLHTDRNPVPVSDNPAFDMAFLNDFLYQADVEGLFGHSGRRIGDFYAGVTGKWKNANRWKKFRRTEHTHHPIADSRGNAEALRTILGLVQN